MKSKLFSALLVAVLVFVAVIPASAQLGTTDFSSFTIQNIDTISASVTVQFIASNGQVYQPAQLDSLSPATPNPFTLAVGASKEIVTTNIPATQLPAGQYSVVIFSSAKVLAIASVAGSGARRFSGSYSGFDTGATAAYIPSVYHNYSGWYSLISAQNLGSLDSNILLEIVCENGTTGTMTASNVKQYASAHFVLKTVRPAGWTASTVCNGSAKVSSTNGQALVATDNQSKPALGNTQSFGAMSNGTSTVYVPTLFYNYFSWNSSLGIRKLGAGNTTVTVTYSNGGTNTCNLTDTQPSCLKYMPADHPTPGTFGATVTSDPAMELIAVANLTRPDRSWSQSYNGFLDGVSTDKVGIPTVQKNYFGWNSSFTCQNVSPSGTTQLRITYSGKAPYVHAEVLDPGEQVEINVAQDSHITETSYQGGVTVEAVNTAVDIACVAGFANLLKYQTVSLGDWATRYNGFAK